MGIRKEGSKEMNFSKGNKKKKRIKNGTTPVPNTMSSK